MNSYSPDAVFSVQNVSKVFRAPAEDVHAVRDVSFSLTSGEFVSLMGPSGCGKSTLLSLLSGNDVVTSGTILFGNHEISSQSSEKRAATRLREMGLVFQEDQLIPEFTVLENVALPLELSGQRFATIFEECQHSLELVGLGNYGKRYPNQLSGGQRQRVGIARALVGDRKVILADEATGSLDHANSKAIFELFKELAESGYSILAATHDLFVLDFAHRNLTMSDGTVEESELSGRAYT